MKVYIISLLCFVGCYSSKESATTVQQTPDNSVAENVEQKKSKRADHIVKTDEEWRQLLNKEEYYVIRDKGTERPFTGTLLKNKEKGVYTCRACDLELFDSKSKFTSGTGWPSYYEPIAAENITEDTDYNLGYARTEILCARCDGHLGHVFPDGPQPTGLRYCVNSVSLSFKKAGE